ncbi:MAG: hypothetical protein WC548_01555 [Candidatus Pacearchaeota archaeon]
MEKEITLKKFWNFLRKDSWASIVVTLILAFIIIKYIFFPILSFLTGTPLPLVIVESCSMHHEKNGFEEIFDISNIYEKNEITLDDTDDWTFQNGFNKGDIIFVVGTTNNVKIGDVIIFNAARSLSPHPIIHRVVKTNETLETKGDNNAGQLTQTNNPNMVDETNIEKNQIIGKAIFRIPYVGWVKLIWFELLKKIDSNLNTNFEFFC